MDIIPLLIQILFGAAGGVVAGSLIQRINEGRLVNLGIGVVGGVVCGQLLGMMVGWIIQDLGSASFPIVISSMTGGALGGAALLLLAGSIGKGPMTPQR